MPLQATSGAASYDAFGGGVAAVPNYIEDVFSTWLYTGNGSTQTINNGIDLAGEGGLVWIKARSNADWNILEDTSRGVNQALSTNRTDAQATFANSVTAFNSNGFSLGSNGVVNDAAYSALVSWTFREQPKFFDVVTYTGNGVSNRAIAHSLGSVPGCIIVKRLTAGTTGDWCVWHRSLNYGEAIFLNRTDAAVSDFYFGSSTPTSTQFYLSTNQQTNASGDTYVAYLFAHNAGGFGLTGTDNVISCGSFTPDGSGNVAVNLGYEPQWILYKNTATGAWNMFDAMRGWGQLSNQILRANSSNAESNVNVSNGDFTPTATGFSSNSQNIVSGSQTYIYIAIRRGPMKTPTTGTSVFSPAVVNAATGTPVTTGFPVDMQLFRYNPAGVPDAAARAFDRLRGVVTNTNTSGSTAVLVTNTTAAESSQTDNTLYWDNTGFQVSSGFSGVANVFWSFRRAPGFFDEVCYTGTGSATTVTHNLTVVPEMMIVKRRSGVADWPVYSSAVGNTKFLLLNSTGDTITDNVWNNTTPTATEFSVRDQNTVNASGSTYVAYLFATVAGVSKVGSYTGTGTTQVIDCGFTSGARFVLIKRSSGTGDWYVWDSARGIVAGNDPYLLLNSTAAEVTNTDFVDTAATGFEISSTAPAAINANGGTFIFLAIA